MNFSKEIDIVNAALAVKTTMAVAQKHDALVDRALKDSENLDSKTAKRITKKVKKLKGDWRQNILDSIGLENYKDYCVLEITKSQTTTKLLNEKQSRAKALAAHWLEMHKGNLEDIGYNTTSVPNKFYYGLDRYVYYLKKRCNAIPKLAWRIAIGCLAVLAIVLAVIGTMKIV